MFENAGRPSEVKNQAKHASSGTGVRLQLERIACPLCGSQESTIIQTSGDNLCGIPGEFAIERCSQCNHRFMNPRPVPESLGDCYPEQYGPHQSAPSVASQSSVVTGRASTVEKRTDSRGRPLYLRILPLRYIPGLKAFYSWLIEDRSQPVPTPIMISPTVSPAVGRQRHDGSNASQQPRALELGCATGHYLTRLTDAGWVATGIEPGERPAAIAIQSGLDVQCGTLESCRFPADFFELAAAWMVIEHVPDPRGTLQELHRLLKPDGTLLFSIPNAGCWEPKVFGRYWYVWELPRHLHHFTPRSIRMLLTQVGFSEIKIIHQRNLSNVIGSLALVTLASWPESRIGRWLLRYPDTPSTLLKLMLAPIAHVLAWLGQGGRLTISARRPPHPPSEIMGPPGARP